RGLTVPLSVLFRRQPVPRLPRAAERRGSPARGRARGCAPVSRRGGRVSVGRFLEDPAPPGLVRAVPSLGSSGPARPVRSLRRGSRPGGLARGLGAVLGAQGPLRRA